MLRGGANRVAAPPESLAVELQLHVTCASDEHPRVF